MQQTAVIWLIEQLKLFKLLKDNNLLTSEEWKELFDQAKEMEKEQMLDFGEFIIDELEPMAQNREWVEERYNYFSE